MKAADVRQCQPCHQARQGGDQSTPFDGLVPRIAQQREQHRHRPDDRRREHRPGKVHAGGDAHAITQATQRAQPACQQSLARRDQVQMSATQEYPTDAQPADEQESHEHQVVEAVGAGHVGGDEVQRPAEGCNHSKEQSDKY